jgi:acetyl-CoA carboxylase biotin carboxyl carrier protein|nr:biotin/lipoyl-containing protein [Kofleriaceae bacterium]
MTRLHARSTDAVLHGDELTSPAPGRFRPAIGQGDLVHGGAVVGELDVLGRVSRVVAPDGARGVVTAIADGPVDFGTALVRFDPNAAMGAGEAAHGAAQTAAAAQTTGRVFRAPTSGRLYTRPGPGKDAFVAIGSELRAGSTVCLLEVMKTFHRVTYSGEPARVAALLVADGADVNAGDPLLSLE